ncbi:MAG: hypothetical protein ACR2FJ_05785 [Qipengyuania sp.]
MAGGISQNQLDALFTAALEAGVALIEKSGFFLPLLFELRSSGEIQAVAMLDKEASDEQDEELARLARVLATRASQGLIQAVAIAVNRPADFAIELRMRAPDYAANILAPYRIETSGLMKRKRRLVLDSFAGEPARNEIFGDG